MNEENKEINIEKKSEYPVADAFTNVLFAILKLVFAVAIGAAAYFIYFWIGFKGE